MGEDSGGVTWIRQNVTAASIGQWPKFHFLAESSARVGKGQRGWKLQPAKAEIKNVASDAPNTVPVSALSRCVIFYFFSNCRESQFATCYPSAGMKKVYFFMPAALGALEECRPADIKRSVPLVRAIQIRTQPHAHGNNSGVSVETWKRLQENIDFFSE